MDEAMMQQAALEAMMADPSMGQAPTDPFAAPPGGGGGMVTISVPEWSVPAIAELLTALEGGGGMDPLAAPPMAPPAGAPMGGMPPMM